MEYSNDKVTYHYMTEATNYGYGKSYGVNNQLFIQASIIAFKNGFL